MFRIFTDTSSNLDSELLKRKNVSVVPFSYYVNGEERTCLDTHAFNGSGYYDAIRNGARVTTSQVPPQRYIDAMTPVLEGGEDILFVGMSSGISGAYSAAEMAAGRLLEQFPERKIRLVDTLSASLAEGIVVLRAIELREAGKTLDETADELMELRHSVCQIFTVEDLRYLRMGGRLSNIAALVGTVLQIKPLLKGDPEGKIVCFAKPRGRKRSIAELGALYDRLVVHPENQTVCIAHGDCLPEAEALAERLRANHPPKEIMIEMYEPVTGAHVGPGNIALFFLSNSKVREEL